MELSEQILFRLTPDQRARVETIRRRMQAEQPGMKVSTSDAVRHAIIIASTGAELPAGVERTEPNLHGLPPKRRRRKARAA